MKAAFRRWAASCVCPPGLPRCGCGWSAKGRVLTTRPLRPTGEEIAATRAPAAPGSGSSNDSRRHHERARAASPITPYALGAASAGAARRRPSPAHAGHPQPHRTAHRRARSGPGRPLSGAGLAPPAGGERRLRAVGRSQAPPAPRPRGARAACRARHPAGCVCARRGRAHQGSASWNHDPGQVVEIR